MESLRHETPDIETSSDSYAGRFSGAAGAYLLAVQQQVLGRALGNCTGANVLEVGGGHGQSVQVLLERGSKITILGSDQTTHRRIRRLYGAGSIRCVTGNILRLPFEDRSFDIVVAVRLIAHIEQWRRLLAELCRVACHAVVIDYPRRVSLNGLTPVLFYVKRLLEGNTRRYASFFEGDLEQAFEEHGFAMTWSCNQFFLPMFLHRLGQGARWLQGLEGAFRWAHLTRFFGSPGIVCAERGASAGKPLQRARAHDPPRLDGASRTQLAVLLVAPNPFFQERGTCIAVRMVCETLCEAGHRVDLLTYHVGQDLAVQGLDIIRIPRPPFIDDVPIGFSWKKIVCDVLLGFSLFRVVSCGRYDVVHAVEEAIFPAMLANVFARAKLIYDMDSSMADQLVERWEWLRRFSPLLYGFESLAIRRADSILAVCHDIAERARAGDAKRHVVVLQDVPLEVKPEADAVESLRQTCSIHGPLILYAGNLEHYQGIDLLLEGFAALRAIAAADLVVIGGTRQDTETYKARAQALGVLSSTHFLGRRPIAHVACLLEQASMVVSPRLRGNNTPMKIFSYLASGRPIVATNVRAHTQVLDPSCALLVECTPNGLADALCRLIRDPELGERLGLAGKRLAAERHSVAQYRQKLIDEYARLAGASEGCSEG